MTIKMNAVTMCRKENNISVFLIVISLDCTLEIKKKYYHAEVLPVLHYRTYSVSSDIKATRRLILKQ